MKKAIFVFSPKKKIKMKDKSTYIYLLFFPRLSKNNTEVYLKITIHEQWKRGRKQCTQQMIATNSGGGANGDELVSNEANEDATSMHTQWAAVES